MWNSLSDCVVDTDNLDKFRTRIDEFWQHQEVLFNYKSELWNRKPITDLDLEIRTCAKRLSPFFAYVMLCHVVYRMVSF